MNKAILMGRLTADPELKTTPNGILVTSFSLAVDRKYAGQDGERKTDFINIVAWRQRAEFICKYFVKGQLIALDGSIETRSYVDKNGNNRTAIEVVVENAYFTGDKRSSANNQAGSSYKNNPAAVDVPQKRAETHVRDGNVDYEQLTLADEDLPF